MRQVDRTQIKSPGVLTGAKSVGGKELTKARTFMQVMAANPPVQISAKKKKAGFPFKAYSQQEVKDRLEHLFHGKCAYCESLYAGQAPVDVEHYRPKGHVAGEVHPGYWWLAMRWDNLLPSCLDCNRQRWQKLPVAPAGLLPILKGSKQKQGLALLGKKDLFPIAGIRATAEGQDDTQEAQALLAEDALLLDPTRDDPDTCLEYHLDRTHMLALILPTSTNGVVNQRGLHSIHVYGLNRLVLVQERTRVLRRLEFYRDIITELNDLVDRLTTTPNPRNAEAGSLRILRDQILNEIHDMAADTEPFCSLVRAWGRTL